MDYIKKTTSEIIEKILSKGVRDMPQNPAAQGYDERQIRAFYYIPEEEILKLIEQIENEIIKMFSNLDMSSKNIKKGDGEYSIQQVSNEISWSETNELVKEIENPDDTETEIRWENKAVEKYSVNLGRRNYNEGFGSLTFGNRNVIKNTQKGKSDSSGCCAYNVVFNNNNYLKDVTNSAMFGSNNILIAAYDKTKTYGGWIYGHMCKAENTYLTSLLGAFHKAINAKHCLISGNANTIEGTEEKPIENSLMHGTRLRCTHSNATILGHDNDEKPGTLLEIGNGTPPTNEDGTGGKKSNAFEVYEDGRAKVYGKPREPKDVVRLEDIEVNPTDVATEELKTLKVGETTYSVSGGENKLYLCVISAKRKDTTSDGHEHEYICKIGIYTSKKRTIREWLDYIAMVRDAGIGLGMPANGYVSDQNLTLKTAKHMSVNYLSAGDNYFSANSYSFFINGAFNTTDINIDYFEA